ncbi:DUF1552 domain-containing protein [Akkermansiaceae bacterium]|nr:DUF1552 domain-containing protein [Akkermansiaceae bacterium]
MHTPRPALNRRALLKGSGAAMALPFLEAMIPSFAWARPAVAAAAQNSPKRMLAICSNMGFMPEYFWPKGTGKGYEMSPYLKLLEKYRNDFTVFSGVSHPNVDGGHHAEVSFLTAAPHPASGGFRNTISLDQFAAERIGPATRFPSLVLDVGTESGKGLSWTASGVNIPAEQRPSNVYKRLFVQGSPAEVERQIDGLREGRSILDAVSDRAKGLNRDLAKPDQEKLDQYFTSVRELEQRLVKNEEWEKQPKPKVDALMPTDNDDRGALVERTRLMQEMAKLAFVTDSTRLITLKIDQNANPKVNLPGVTQGHHSLTHHGKKGENVEQLKIIESAQIDVFGELLQSFKDTPDAGGKTLLDHTAVLYGSNLGNANSHDNRNMPTILAGGGFEHGQHLAFDTKDNHPLPNLFVNLLQHLEIEADRFASGTKTIPGLDRRS